MATRSASAAGEEDFITLRLLGVAAFIFALNAPTIVVFETVLGQIGAVVLYSGVALALASLGKWLMIKARSILP